MNVFAIGWAMVALVQDPAPVSAVRDVTLGHFPPWAVLEINPSLRLESEAFSLYAPFTASPQQGGVRYLAWRRLSRHALHGERVEWARVADCPGAEARLLELEALPLPQVDVPLLGREDRQGPPLDGVGYSLWFQYGKWPDGFAYAATVTSNVGTPLAIWADQFRRTMEPCWTSEEPPAWDSAPR